MLNTLIKYHSFPSISFSHPCRNLLAPKNNYLAGKGEPRAGMEGGRETLHKAAAFFLINEFALQFCEAAGRLGWGGSAGSSLKQHLKKLLVQFMQIGAVGYGRHQKGRIEYKAPWMVFSDALTRNTLCPSWNSCNNRKPCPSHLQLSSLST